MIARGHNIEGNLLGMEWGVNIQKTNIELKVNQSKHCQNDFPIKKNNVIE